MPRTILFCVLLCFLVPAFSMPERAAAADGKILDATIDRYMEEAAKWEPRIKQAAKTMFWILATISMVFTFAFMYAKGNTSLGDFFGEFLRFIVTTGFFLWLLDNGSAIAKAIITSFAQLGLEASSTYQSDLSPSNLISFALELIMRSCASFGEQDMVTSAIALLLSIAIAVLFGIIAAMMVLLLCSAWVLVYAGVIYLGFGGGRWTTDIAINYFKTVLGLAMQTFTFCLLVGIGQAQIERLITQSKEVKTVTVKGYVFWDSTVNTTSMTITEGCVILIFTVVLFMLVKTVPQMVAGVVNGSSTGGISLGGSGGMMAGAAAVASGGAMIAMQAAGAGMALASAYQQTKENKASGEGMFKGGGGGGGLTGAMSSGLRTAGDFMANLASGAMDTAKDKAQGMMESVQSNSVGGQVSANIDAERAENKAKQAANAETGKEGGGDTGAGDSVSGGDGGSDGGGGSGVSGAGGGGGGDGGGSSGNAAAESSPGVSSSAASDGAAGAEAANAPTGSSLSATTDDAQGGDTGGGLDWGGSISGGESDPARDEWEAAIRDYDPSKVGLPEG